MFFVTHASSALSQSQLRRDAPQFSHRFYLIDTIPRVFVDKASHDNFHEIERTSAGAA